MTGRGKTTLFLAALGLLAWAGQALAQDSLARGKEIYEDRCAACHRGSGQGLPPTFPALKGSALVLGEPTPLIDLVLKGRKGLSTMPAWQGQLDKRQLADVLSYLRASWGNQAAPVSPEQVAARQK